MIRRSFLTIGVASVAASLALAGCGDRGSSTSNDSSSGAGKDGKKVAVIGIMAPLSGDLSALGKGIQHSVELAVKQANESGELGDWTLKTKEMDDEGKPDVGQNAATSLVGEDNIIGAVGPLNSSVGQIVQPVFESAGVALVSPANTNPALTKGADFETAPKRQNKTYFRTATTDAVQGPFAANYVFKDAGAKKVATIHDKKAYGQGLVTAFTKEYKKLGGEIVAEETINPDDSNFSAVIAAVKSKNPDVVYYGGEYPQAGPLSKQMKAAGLNVPLMGGDGIFSPEFINLAGKTESNGDFSTSVGAPTEKLASAKKFIKDYEAAGYADPYEAYGAYSYDAATAIIEAFKAAKPKELKDAKAARKAVVEQLSNVKFDGVTGKVGFDEYGDNTSRVLTVYKVVDGKWVDEKTQDFQ